MEYRPKAVLSPPSLPELPSFIPMLTDGLPKDISLSGNALYGVSLGHLLKRRGGVRHLYAKSLRERLGLSESARLFLVGTSQEDVLENAWKSSLTLDTWRELCKLDFEIATSTTFSVWEDQSRFDQVYAQDRNLASVDFLSGLGVPTIPFFFCGANEDYREAARWLESRPTLNTMGVLTQFYKHFGSFCAFFEKLRYFIEVMPRPLRLVFVGSATANKIQMIFSEFPDSTIVTTRPVLVGLSGELITDTLDQELADPSQDRAALITHNINQFSAFCKQLRA